MFKRLTILMLLFAATSIANAQTVIGEDNKVNYLTPKEYEIGGVTVSGTQYLDQGVLISLTGLTVGEKVQVPGEKITKAIENLWKQGLFADIKINAQKFQGKLVFLDIVLQERPRLSKFSFKGVSKGEADKIREKVKLSTGKVLTDNLLKNATNQTRQYFVDEGYLNAEVALEQKRDTTTTNSNILVISVKKNKRIKINSIVFEGATSFTPRALHTAMKDTKEKHWYRVFSSSKFLDEKYQEDKAKIIAKYNAKGFRDAHVVKDSIWRNDANTINIKLNIEEGHKFYFGNITWVGNTKHTSEELSNVLGIKKGELFNQSSLDSRLFMNPNGRDVSSLYLDDGYLFFQINPIEVKVENDSIDLEMRIYEGKQATINKVTVTGNTKTNDRVIMREIRTKPGQLFSRSDIIRTQRELSQLGYFNPEKLNVNPKPNPADGTVDINYVVEEKPSDQVELSGGYGAGRLIGTLGVTFNNFSARNIFNAGAWRPLPAGDGQRLSLRVQTNGVYYQSYNASFVEPWLGGKRPNSLSVSVFRSVQTNGIVSNDDPSKQAIYITGGSVGLGRRLKFPDDYFTLVQDITFQHYELHNFTSTFLFSNGNANNISLGTTLSRSSIDQPIYPRTGSQFTGSIQLTPPYSYFNKVDYTTASTAERYRFLEYYKWKLNATWISRIKGDLVLSTKAKFGFLGAYNPLVGDSPFERFYLGGDGLSGYALDGREIIALRGYENNSLTPKGSNGGYIGATLYNKFVMELRYPISLNPSATIYGLAFAEAGNAWLKFKDYNPFESKRSVGFGLRIFLPMLGGLLGLDYGWGLDPILNNPNANHGQFHFSIGASME